tara:strand:+ start:15888 stop:16244 length:357 start_codon:yes stop_codon:yes gene_type:complete
MKTKETVAQEALRLLLEIPAEDFITDRFSDGKGKCCAIGHYTRLKSNNPLDYGNDNCIDLGNSLLRRRSSHFLVKKHNLNSFNNIATVNNANNVNGYTEPVIKDRVIHLLKDMVNEGL